MGEKIIGYRLWRHEEYSSYRPRLNTSPQILMSCGVKESWKPGINQATCKTSRRGVLFGVKQLYDVFNKHFSPAAKCTCGFWAFRNLDILRKRNSYEGIGGIILGSGKIISHTFGFRAEKVEVIALFPNWELDLAPIAEAFNIPILAPENALLLAKEKGGVLLDDVPEEWKRAKILPRPKNTSSATGATIQQITLPITSFAFTYNLNATHTSLISAGTMGKCSQCGLVPAAQPGSRPGDRIDITCSCGKVTRYQRI